MVMLIASSFNKLNPVVKLSVFLFSFYQKDPSYHSIRAMFLEPGFTERLGIFTSQPLGPHTTTKTICSTMVLGVGPALQKSTKKIVGWWFLSQTVFTSMHLQKAVSTEFLEVDDFFFPWGFQNTGFGFGRVTRHKIRTPKTMNVI